MLQKQTLRKPPDASVLSARQGAQCKQQLVLMRLKSGIHRRLVAATNELANAVADFRERRVFRGLHNSSCHFSSISRRDISATQALAPGQLLLVTQEGAAKYARGTAREKTTSEKNIASRY